MGLRFLFTNIGYPPFVGGAQTYVQLLAESLVRDGHQVTVYTTDGGEVERVWNAGKRALPAGVEAVNGVMVERLPLRHLPPSPLAYYLIRRLTVALAQVPAVPEGLLWGLARFTPWVPALDLALARRTEPVDLVHGFTIPFESVLKPAADYAARIDVPFVVTPFLHIGEESDHRVARGYAMPHQVALLRRAAAVVALSDLERAFLLARGLAPERVHTLHAGIPVPADCVPIHERPRGDHAATVLFLGAVTYEKGAVHLTEALRRLWTEGLPIELVLAGTVTDQYRHYYDRLPAGDRGRVQLRGVVSEEEKQALLRECTLLAMPSRVDSFGLVYLEAWRYGKPVIGARAGGVPAVIDHEQNGLLVHFGDVAALATAIRRLVVDADEARRLGHAGWGKLQAQYTWDRAYAGLAKLYQQVLAR